MNGFSKSRIFSRIYTDAKYYKLRSSVHPGRKCVSKVLDTSVSRNCLAGSRYVLYFVSLRWGARWFCKGTSCLLAFISVISNGQLKNDSQSSTANRPVFWLPSQLISSRVDIHEWCIVCIFSSALSWRLYNPIELIDYKLRQFILPS